MTDDQIREMIQTIQSGEREEAYSEIKDMGGHCLICSANRQGLLDFTSACLETIVALKKETPEQYAYINPNPNIKQRTIEAEQFFLEAFHRVDNWPANDNNLQKDNSFIWFNRLFLFAVVLMVFFLCSGIIFWLRLVSVLIFK